MLIKEIGLHMKKYRKEHSLTQQDLAKMLEISVQSIINYEKGRSQPNMFTVMKFASISGISINDLVFIDKVKKSLKDPIKQQIISEFLSVYQLQLNVQNNKLIVVSKIEQLSRNVNSNINVDF